MAVIKANGLVLNSRPFGDRKAYLTILTKEYGLLDILVRSKPTKLTKQLTATDLFVLSQFVLFESKGRYTLNEASLIADFYHAKCDLDALTCLTHLSEVFRTITTVDAADEVYQLACYAIYAIDQMAKRRSLDASEFIDCVRATEVRALAIAGYPFSMPNCLYCGTTVNQMDQKAWFSLDECGFICQKSTCLGTHRQRLLRSPYTGMHTSFGDQVAINRTMRLSTDTIKALQHFTHAPYSKLFRFKLSPVVRSELAQVVPPYLNERLEHEFNELAFLKKLQF